MKSIFRYVIFAAAAAGAVLASCSKDSVVESNSGTAVEGLRTITLQFSTDTKATINGIKSNFENGDHIRISNSERSEDATVWVENGIASITTNLTGFLTAVYPGTAANVTGNGPIGTPAYKVPAQQNGTPGNALIAVAKISGTSAVFDFQAALFEITPPSTATKITIKSLKEVVSGARTGAAAEINTDGSNKTVITVGNGSTNLPSPIYVAFNPGVKLTNLSFDAGETIGMKGIPTSTVGTNPDVTVIKGKYKINISNWHPYVTIGGLKWATMNIGADSATDRGEYFAWGGVTGQTLSGSNTFSPGFTMSNAPHSNGSAYTKYTSSDGKTVLELADDAAFVNWGGPWRMPTGEPDTGEFVKMWESGFMAWDDGTNKGYYYFVPSEIGKSAGRGSLTDVSSDKRSLSKLFFPAVGASSDSNLGDANVCHYWSSSLSPSDKNNACYIKAAGVGSGGMYVIPEQYIRYSGRSVRPVADP